MVFNSITFFAFFGIVLALYSQPWSWRSKKILLVVASSLFYAAWNPLFLLLLWISICVDWQIATRMVRFSARGRKRLLLVSLTVNLGLLAVFKYGKFISKNVAALLALIGIHSNPSTFDIALPVGISFYTFETLSYTIDVYRNDERPWKSFLDFAVFLTFFPHLVAGPIVRPSAFLPQCDAPRRATWRQFSWGITLLIFGLFEKSVIADGTLGPLADRVFSNSASAGLADAWAGALAFSGQIFCDFAGYSLCAIGVALCFGFLLPDNFNCPYAALGFSEFWQRWHISLSSWLRDYLYVSLGGNRKGRARTYANLGITMLIGGLWHGASWTFVAWGGLHGAYLICERLLRGRGRHLPPGSTVNSRVVVSVGLTFVLTTVAWVFFRATEFREAFTILRAMGAFGGAKLVNVLGKRDVVSVLVITATMLALQWRLRNRPLSQFVESMRPAVRASLLAAMVVMIVTATGANRAFIYFQF